MCLAIPSRVLEVDDLMAVVDSAGERRKVSLILMHEDVAVGDYVLIQHGQFAFERVDAERAREAAEPGRIHDKMRHAHRA